MVFGSPNKLDMTRKDDIITIAPAPQNGSSFSGPHRSNFVKALDTKARSYFKTLERSFSSSMVERRDEDISAITIEFLQARLQAQRAEYKAEKQRAQQLATKVLELEQQLCFEIERRKRAECLDLQIAPGYRSSKNMSGSPIDGTYTDSGIKEALIHSKLSPGEDDNSEWCSEISENEGLPERDEVLLISPSSLRHHLEKWKHGHPHRPPENGISLGKDIKKPLESDRGYSLSASKESRSNPWGRIYGKDDDLHVQQEDYAGSRTRDMDRHTKAWRRAYSLDGFPKHGHSLLGCEEASGCTFCKRWHHRQPWNLRSMQSYSPSQSVATTHTLISPRRGTCAYHSCLGKLEYRSCPQGLLGEGARKKENVDDYERTMHLHKTMADYGRGTCKQDLELPLKHDLELHASCPFNNDSFLSGVGGHVQSLHGRRRMSLDGGLERLQDIVMACEAQDLGNPS